jgi:hypothetical protein
MTWDDVLERLGDAGLKPVEEIYIDNYGNTLPVEYPRFRGRLFRCARGIVECRGLRVEVYIFPSEGHLEDFIEVMGEDPLWVARRNVVFHFPESDSVFIGSILDAISDTAE